MALKVVIAAAIFAFFSAFTTATDPSFSAVPKGSDLWKYLISEPSQVCRSLSTSQNNSYIDEAAIHNTLAGAAQPASAKSENCSNIPNCQKCAASPGCHWCGPDVASDVTNHSPKLFMFGRCEAKETQCPKYAMLGGLSSAPFFAYAVSKLERAKMSERTAADVMTCQPMDVPPEFKMADCRECFDFGVRENLRTNWCRLGFPWNPANILGLCVREELSFLCNQEVVSTVYGPKDFTLDLVREKQLCRAASPLPAAPPSQPRTKCEDYSDCQSCSAAPHGCTYCAAFLDRFDGLPPAHIEAGVGPPRSVFGACRPAAAGVCDSVKFANLDSTELKGFFEVRPVTGDQCTAIPWPPAFARSCSECLTAGDSGWCDYEVPPFDGGGPAAFRGFGASRNYSVGMCLPKGLQFLCTYGQPSSTLGIRGTFKEYGATCPGSPHAVTTTSTPTTAATTITAAITAATLGATAPPVTKPGAAAAEAPMGVAALTLGVLLLLGRM